MKTNSRKYQGKWNQKGMRNIFKTFYNQELKNRMHRKFNLELWMIKLIIILKAKINKAFNIVNHQINRMIIK